MKIYCSLFVLLFWFSTSFSQVTSKTNADELKHGIQFQVSGIISLMNYEGYTLSYRYRFSKCSGLRIGVLARMSDIENDFSQQLDSVSYKPTEFEKYYSYKFSVQYLHTIAGYKDFSLVAAGGPFISYVNRESYFDRLSGSPDRKIFYRNLNKGFSYGMDFLLGVEYNLLPNIVISGEYGLTITKQKLDVEYESIDDFGTYQSVRRETGQSTGTVIKNLSANLGLAVFF